MKLVLIIQDLEEDKLKTILVTGGAGFIGSHLCKVLVDKGNKVICLDNLITGSKININQLLKRKNFEFINHDITEPFYRNQIDEIYNLACPASPIQYRNNPIKTIKTCTIGVINMLGLAKKNNAKILQASTSEVYGDPETHPQNECYNGNVNVMSPRACYDEGKRCAETLFIDYHREHNLDIRIVRIFNTYGPNMSINDGRVVSNFICQAIQGKNITVNGTGKQTRSFLYVDDLINGLTAVMSNSLNYNHPINLGNPNEISIYDLANGISKLLKSNSKIVFENLPEDDPKRRRPDISLAKKLINWEPKTSLNKGLENTVKYFSNEV